MKPKVKFLKVPYEGSHSVTERTLDKDGKLVDRERVVKGGYMVKFPRGHSIYVPDDKELSRLGLDGSGFVDMETGLDIPPVYVKAMGFDQDPRALEMEG